jgi:hypothetical protein
MKSFPLAGSVLSVLLVCACSGESQPPAAVAGHAQPPSPAPAASAGASAPAATQQPAAQAPSPQPPAGQAGAQFARNGAKRYQGAEGNKLASQYDVSKVKVDPAADEHDHEHPESNVSEIQDGRSLLPAAQAEKNKGRIELTDGVQQVHDFGPLRQGESASYDFPFVSNGEEPLVISGVKPSCGCTKAEIVLLGDDGTRKPYVKGDPIPVGQRFLLESEIATDGKPGGPFNANVSLYGNDVRGAFNVRLTANIEPVLTITPSPTVFFGRITTADRVEQVVKVTSTRGEPFHLTIGQESVQEAVKLEYTAKEPDATGKSNEWNIKVVFGPNAQIGMRSYPINFRTDLPIAHPKFPSPDGKPQMHGFMLNVQAQVSGMVSAEPSFLTFGMVKPGEALERSLRIECHDDFQLKADMPVTFEGLQGQELAFKDAFAVTIEPEADARGADVKVKLKGMPADLNGSFGGVLRIKVGHPYMDEIQIRFSGVCRPGLPQTAAQPPGQQQK